MSFEKKSLPGTAVLPTWDIRTGNLPSFNRLIRLVRIPRI